MTNKPKVILEDLKSISYKKAWDYQATKMDELKEIKKWNRHQEPQKEQKHYLLLCEHNPVYTIGKSGSMDHLLQNEEELEKNGFEFFKINRGGDITYHGPGQLTVYPILDLDYFFHDVHKYVRLLEEVVIRTLEAFDIKAQREESFTGVWIDGLPKRKICAIGVHMSRWITMHGFALNVNTDLSHFGNIVPCGIDSDDKTVTSIEQELGAPVDMTKLKEVVSEVFAEVFDFDYAS